MSAVVHEIALGKRWFASVADLAPNDAQRVNQAVIKFTSDPGHPSLNFEKLNAKDDRLWSIRATQKIRILIWREGSVCALLEAGQHDIYRELANGRFIYNSETGFVGVIDVGAVEIGEHAPRVLRLTSPADDESRPGVLDHWPDADLREAGFADDVIALLRSCRAEEDLLDAGLSTEDFERAVDLIELTPEQFRAPELLADRPLAEERLRLAITQFGAAHGLSPFYTPDELAKIAAAPIEDWMIFLHPSQRAVCDRRYEGPARIRGAAGTGKTVVALHRAAVLAHRFAEEESDALPILFTTYIKTLPPVFESLYNRLLNAKPGAVEFVHVDKLARRVVKEANLSALLNPRAIDAAFATGFKRVVTKGSSLEKASLTSRYLRDEITSVIKGRGIASLDDYLSVERTGRIVPFTEPMRRQVWQLMIEWYEEMSRRGTVDFSDVLLLARDAARRRTTPTYRAAIVDESQDLTLVGLQLVRALVNGAGSDRSDGMLLVGDGAQRIYPGCFTLRQAGIEVTGRSTVLRTNYRNTAEIIGAALAVAGDQQVDDLGEVYERGDADVASVRSAGVRPALIECAGRDDEAMFLLRRIAELVENGTLQYGDVGVFVPTNKDSDRFIGLLRRAGLPAADLTKSDDLAAGSVKVGTYFRAKGLEFKVVFLPGLDEAFPRPIAQGQDAGEYDEARALSVSQLYVAMTRARDALFLTTPGHPSPLLVEHLDAFEVLES